MSYFKNEEINPNGIRFGYQINDAEDINDIDCDVEPIDDETNRMSTIEETINCQIILERIVEKGKLPKEEITIDNAGEVLIENDVVKIRHLFEPTYEEKVYEFPLSDID